MVPQHSLQLFTCFFKTFKSKLLDCIICSNNDNFESPITDSIDESICAFSAKKGASSRPILPQMLSFISSGTITPYLSPICKVLPSSTATSTSLISGTTMLYCRTRKPHPRFMLPSSQSTQQGDTSVSVCRSRKAIALRTNNPLHGADTFCTF